MGFARVKRIRVLWLATVAALLIPFEGNADEIEDLNTIKVRLYEIAVSHTGSNHDIGNLFDHFDEKTGLFTDIDYLDQTASSRWDPGYHWRRLSRLALEYEDATSPNWHSSKVKDCVLKGIRVWLEQPPIANNAWWNLIGVPTEMANVFILMENEVGQELIRSSLPLLNYAVKPEYYDYHGPATGENLLWETFNHIAASVLIKDADGVRRAVGASAEAIRITEREGIQPDYSFYQHGTQAYDFGYGKSFSLTASQILYAIRGTSFELPPEKAEILSHYILDGQQWCSYFRMLEYTAMGREISRPDDKTEGILRASRLMRQVDVSRQEEYDDYIAQLEGRPRKKLLEGSRYYDRIKLLVQQGEDYFFSVKNASFPIKYTEGGNRENLKGRYLGDGTQFISRTGDEYEGIFPIWNWRRLPGSVIEQSSGVLAPHDWGKGAEGPDTFAYGLSDGNAGFFSIRTDREGITSNRSWFCVDGKIVHMFSGLSFEKAHEVWQTVNQTFQRTDVYINNRKMDVDSMSVSVKSVWQDSVGYYFPEKTKVIVLAKQQSGSWYEINNAYSRESISKDVFTLSENFGKAVDGKSSCYIICPNVSSGDDLAKKCSDLRVVANTADLHCIFSRNTVTYYLTSFTDNLVFRIPGTGKKLKIEHPSLCILKKQADGKWTVSLNEAGKVTESVI